MDHALSIPEISKLMRRMAASPPERQVEPGRGGADRTETMAEPEHKLPGRAPERWLGTVE